MPVAGTERPARRGIGAALLAVSLAAALALAAPAGRAQDTPAPAPALRIAVISQDQLFIGSAFGKALQARADAALSELQAENQRLDAALELEERALTARRAALGLEAFRPLALAFDEKVKGIRTAQDNKSRELARLAEEGRQRFYQTARPVLEDLMRETGAAILLDRSTVLLAQDALDLTDRAIARIDAVLGDGSTPAPNSPAPPSPAAPDPAAPSQP